MCIALIFQWVAYRFPSVSYGDIRAMLKIQIPKRKKSKKIRKLYLAVAFFFALFSFGNRTDAAVVVTQTVRDGNSQNLSNSQWVQHNLTFTSTTTIRAIITFPSSSDSTCDSGLSGYPLGASIGGSIIFGKYGTYGTSTKLASGGCLFTVDLAHGYTVNPYTNYNLYMQNNNYREQEYPGTSMQGSVSDTVPGVAGHLNTNDNSYRGNDANIADYAFVLCSTEDCSDVAIATNSRVISAYPNATTTATTTVSVGGTYYNNDVTARVVSMTIQITNRQPPFAVVERVYPTTSSAVNSVADTFVLSPGDYAGLYTLQFASSSNPSPGDIANSFMLTNFSVIQQIQQTYASVGTSTQYQQMQDDCAAETELLPRVGCFIVDKFNQLFQYLFVPDTNTVNLFGSFNSVLSQKFPFAYVYDMNEMRMELFDSTQTATTTVGVNVPHFGQITFLSKPLLEAVPYSTTVRTIIGWILWLLGVEYIYLRVLKSHDNHTPS